MKGRGITTVRGDRDAAARSPGPAWSGADGTDDRARRAANVVLAAGSVPRTIPGFEVDGRFVLTSDEVLALDDAAGVGGRHRRRGHRLRVRLDVLRPRDAR